jgi:hypothetical protein
MNQSNLIIENPDGTIIKNSGATEIDALREKIYDISSPFWSQGNGDMVITHYYDSKKYYTLMVFPNNECGIYLRYSRYDKDNEELGVEWLSLEDKNKLGEEVAEYSFEMYASIGFFITPENAWKAIKHFCLTDKRTTEIEWICLDDVPEGCNF